MISAQALSRLLYTLYSAPQVPELWTDFLRDLSRALGLTGAAILHHDVESADYNVQFSSDDCSEWGDLYHTYYGNLDTWRDPFLKVGESEFALGDELCSPETIRKTEFFNDFLMKFDIRLFGAVATVRRPNQLEHISLYQSWKRKPPSRGAAAGMALVYPHLRNALDLRRRFIDLRVRDSLTDGALNASGDGIIVLDETGRVLLMNRPAEELVRNRQGLIIKGGRLRAFDFKESRDSLSLIRVVIATALGNGTAPGSTMFISKGRPRSSNHVSLRSRVSVQPRHVARLQSYSFPIRNSQFDSHRSFCIAITSLRQPKHD